MSILPEKISRTIIQVRNLQLRLHVGLRREDGSFHNEYVFENKMYIKIAPAAYITLGLTSEDGGFYHDRSVMVTQINLVHLINAMKETLKSIYEEKIFALKDNEIIMYSDMEKKYTRQIRLLYSNSMVVIKPTVVYDENEVSYEGVTIYLNKTNNNVQLTISEYESLVYCIEKIDLFQYSQLLINYFMSRNKDITEIEEKKEPKRIRNRVDWNKPSIEASANFRKSTDDIFGGLKRTD